MTESAPGTPVNPLPPSTPFSDPWVFYRLSWGSIFAGAFVAISIHLLLTALALSFGLAIGPDLRAEHPVGLTAGAGIAWTLSCLISLWLGGWLAGRTAGHGYGNIGGLHGITVWGVVTFVSFILMARQGSHLGGHYWGEDSGALDEQTEKSLAIIASWTFLTLAVGAFAAGWGGRCGALRGVAFRRMT